MKGPPFIALLLFAALFAAHPAAAQSPIQARGEGTSLPDQVGPPVVASSAAPASASAASASKVGVTTYHYDNLRTGWNPNETPLAAASFPKHVRETCHCSAR